MKRSIVCATAIASCVSALSSVHLQAESLWVKDKLFVPLRSGPSSQHRILHKGLASGTQVEGLGEKKDGWLHIKTQSGIEGWLPEQYLLQSPTAGVQLAAAQQKSQKSSAKAAELLEKNKALTTELKKTKTQLLQTEKEKQQFNMELHRIKSISSGAIELDSNYQQLLEDHKLLQTENDSLNAENITLKSDRRSSYMYNGALLVILGMLAAVIIPRLRPKKRNSEWA
ncbi:TIGR04211 family SH3 domain-containing protein [Agaribacterium sp. ZY112]|uniref:TIGR04211 family SH3 domain-containing protein n=1 Tax=Agaribacterium sp. ZY112 TaxID=3233574 RepID=UPI00352698D4